MDEAAARRAATLELGGVEQVKEEVRQIRLGYSLNRAPRATAGRSAARSRNLLVSAEDALAALLLVGCALMFRSFVRLSGTDPGFDPHNVVTANEWHD